MSALSIQQALEIGLEHHKAGRLQQAETIYRQVLSAAPDQPDALRFLGVMAVNAGRADVGCQLLEASVRQRPGHADTLSNFAVALNSANRFAEAIQTAERALAIDPNIFEARFSIVWGLHRLNENERALPLVLELVEQNPSHAHLISTAAAIAMNLRRTDQSLALTERALAIDPEFAIAHWNRAMALLTLGRMTEGWREMEWRYRCEHLQSLRRRDLDAIAPMWPEGADVAGKTMLLHCEGGFGDAFHFVRYLPQVIDRGAQLLVECPAAVYPLFRVLRWPAKVFVRGAQALPKFDVHCALQSLPLHFPSSIEDVPRPIPYLSPDEARVNHWQKKLSSIPDDLLKVGLVWSGSNAALDVRSRALETFAPLASVNGVQFVSLQVGEAAKQSKSPPAGMKLLDFSADLTDFGETAALIANLDLVISVDTSVPHLAGAMGKEVWVVLAYVADFRWLLDRDDTPWYPTMRLFRQGRPGDWGDAIERVRKALEFTSDAKTMKNAGNL